MPWRQERLMALCHSRPVCVRVCLFVLCVQLAGQSSSSTLQIKTEELSRQYKDQLSAMRQEKDQEIQRLRVRTVKEKGENYY